MSNDRKWFEFWKAPKSEAPPTTAPVEVPTPKGWEIDVASDARYGANLDYSGGGHPGAGGLSYETLHAMSRTPVMGAIISTRINQVAEYCVPQPTPYSIGFRVKLKHGQMTDAAKKTARDIENMLMMAGGKHGPGSFEAFMRMIVRDSLVYDQCNFEVLRTRGGRVAGFVPIDATTIRKAKPTEAEGKRGRVNPDTLSYAQYIDNKIVTSYKQEELAWGIRRPRTWIHSKGYGFPELEELIRIITYIVNTETYNAVNFTNGIHSSTILALKSSMSEGQFRRFRRELTAMLTGPANAKRVPMVLLDPRAEYKQEIQSINLSQTNKEMEYSNWMNWLIKIACAMYQMDPAELGFVFGNEGQSGALAQQGPGDRISASKERGLRPLLRAIQHWINAWVVTPYHPDFAFEFVGFDSLSESQRVELDGKALRTFKTVNEIRAEHNLDALDEPMGNLILEPSFLQVFLQDMANKGMGAQETGLAPEEDSANGEESSDDTVDQLEALLRGGGDLAGGTEAIAKAVSVAASEKLLDDTQAAKGGRWVPVPEDGKLKSIIIDI